MNEYILGKILGYARALQIFKPLSILIILITAPLSGIISFHIQQSIKEFLMGISPMKIPVLGYVLGREYDLIPALTGGTVGLVIWFFLFLISRKGMDQVINLYLKWKSKRQKKFEIDFTKTDSTDFSKNWITQGSPLIDAKGLIFTNSNSGCLIKPPSRFKFWKPLRMWKDFEATLKVDFVKIWSVENKEQKSETPEVAISGWKTEKKEFRQFLGIVFKAQSLEDYFMIEAWKIDNILSFRPHIRMSGNWDAPVYNAPQILNLGKNQHIVNIKLKVENNVATLSVGSGKLDWSLPTEYEANLLQHKPTSEGREDLREGAVIRIYFRDKVGMFGFRNYGNEISIVKSLNIKPLQ